MRKSTGKNTCPNAPDAPDASDRGLLPGEPPPAQPARPSQRAAPPAPIQLAATGRQREVAAAKLHFEALEPRILLDGDPAAGVMTLAGSIDVPGEQDYYRFTVDEASRVVLDSLSNRSDLSWRLDGPGGLVARRARSAPPIRHPPAPPAYDLAPGQLPAARRWRAGGAGRLRAARDRRRFGKRNGARHAGQRRARGRQPERSSTASAPAPGTATLFKAARRPPPARFSRRLLDPFGRQEGVSFDARQRWRSGSPYERSGEYLLLLAGDYRQSGGAGLRIHPATRWSTASRRCASAKRRSPTIDQPGKVAHFTFDVDGDDRSHFRPPEQRRLRLVAERAGRSAGRARHGVAKHALRRRRATAVAARKLYPVSRPRRHRHG
jgi:hypothetical protein